MSGWRARTIFCPQPRPTEVSDGRLNRDGSEGRCGCSVAKKNAVAAGGFAQDFNSLAISQLGIY